MVQTRSAESTEHLRVVARGGVTNLAGAVIGAFGQVALVLIIARQLDADSAGEFFALNSAFLVFTALASLGTEAGLGRFLLRFEVLGRKHDVGEALRVTFGPVLGTSLVFGALLYWQAQPIVDLLGVVDPTGATALRVLAVGAPIACLSDLSFASTRAFGRVGPTVTFDRIARSLAQPVVVWVVTMHTHRLDAIAVAWVAPYLLSLAGGLLTLRTTLAEREIRLGWRGSERTPAVRREFWSFTWARGMTQVAQLVIQRADIVLIAALRSPAEAAFYTAATRFVPLGQMATLSFQQVLQPRFTMVIAEKDDVSLRQLFQTGTTWNILVAWPVCCLVGAAPLLYLSVFGDAYGESGAWVVVVMAVSLLLGIACGPLDTVILMLGRSTLSMANVLAAVAVDIGLCVLLIPSQGIIGAALAWFASRAVMTGLGLVQVRRLTGANPMSPSSVLAGGLALGLVAVPVLAGTLVGLGTIAHLAVCLAAGLAYLAAIYALREPFQLTALGRSGRRQEGVGDDLSSVFFASGDGVEAQIPTRLAGLIGEQLPDTRRWWLSDGGSEVPPGVQAVGQRSPALLRRLATADLLVTSGLGAQRPPRRALRGSRTVHVHVWRDTPLQMLGYDAPDRGQDPLGLRLRELRERVDRWDHLVSPSAACTDLLRSALRYDGPVIEIGSPHLDPLFEDVDGSVRRSVRKEHGAGDARVVLHVPSGSGDDQVLGELADGLREDTVLWVRGDVPSVLTGHPRVVDVSTWPRTNDLILGADVLLSDYSPVVYDFAVTGKPIVLLAPDLDEVLHRRTLYVDYVQWAPGPVTRTAAEALEAIRHPDVDPDRRARFVATWCPHEDGHAGERLLTALRDVVRHTPLA